MRKAIENIQIAAGLMLFPFMGLIITLNAMGFDSLLEVITMF